MCDQKVTSACVQVDIENKKQACSSQWYLCKILSYGPNSFQNDRSISKENYDRVAFGLSTLHGLLNISKILIYDVSPYFRKLDKKESKILNEANILELFKINLPEIKHGYVSKMTGNIARCFFNNPELFSKAIYVLIEITKSFLKIYWKSLESFQKYPLKFFETTINEISFLLEDVYLTPTVHKYLVHSLMICKFF